ncbi:MAG TPA: DNA polymerase Y family protein [Roseateles sp.]
MRWLALCCTPDAPGNAGPPQVADAPSGGRQGGALPWGSTDHAGPPQVADALAWLALSFTPRVARLEEAVVAEVSSSLRLFRGARALRQRLQAQAAQAGLALGPQAWAPTALGAVALARCADTNPGRFSDRLDALPLSALSAAHAHHAMLARLGCTRLGELRRLPRPALAKRFGPALLTALDQAYGDLPEVHEWLTLPERFDARLELPWRVEHAPVLLHFAEVLLRQLCAFLAARHAGVRALRLAWQYDAMRPRDVAGSGELTVATADTTRDLPRLTRLLGEHLARTTLAAPAGEIRLSADTVLPLEEGSASLLPGPSDPAERTTTNALLERLSVRLGADRVREGRLHEDHRLDRMQSWQPWPAPPVVAVRRPPGPQPTWLVEPPQPLRCDTREQPTYCGPLTRISGPHRVEAGWWEGHASLQTRDYFVYRSATRGLLWVYHERPSSTASATPSWFLHGVFA